MATREGFCLQNGSLQLRHGLKCAGAIVPKANLKDKERQTYDVIVVGAGYAGLAACRDLCTAGFNVLLLEGRDRIGGRTYTGEVDGHLYEMGGTWVHWSQPHTWREMVRYGFTELLPSHARDKGVNYYTTFFRGNPTNVEHSMAHTMTEKAFRMLCDVDGKLGREAMPYPHNPHFNPAAKQWDGMSVAQRLEQVKDGLTEDESAILQARLTSVCGTSLDKAGFFDVLRWWALGGYSMEGLYDSGDEYKLPTGQSSFARCFFEEALETGNLQYSFETAVTSIKDDGNCVVVNDTWQARRLLCTVPMNVLHSIQFHPALSAEKIAAITGGNINQGAKVHLEVSGTDLRSWSSAVWPVVRVCSASGDGLTPAGNTHIVCFGANSTLSSPEEDARDFVAHVEKLHDMNIEKTIWHNWSIDPFSQGSWCMYPPNHSFEHLEALQQRQGNVFFANADWASGWRGYIDGAIERGGIAARDVSRELRAANK